MACPWQQTASGETPKINLSKNAQKYCISTCFKASLRQPAEERAATKANCNTTVKTQFPIALCCLSCNPQLLLGSLPDNHWTKIKCSGRQALLQCCLSPVQWTGPDPGQLLQALPAGRQPSGLNTTPNFWKTYGIIVISKNRKAA